jgi:ABC-2 type transport system permease protein
LDAVNPFAGALNTYDAVIIDGDPFGAQLSHLSLVLVWLLVTFIAARVAARHITFR